VSACGIGAGAAAACPFPSARPRPHECRFERRDAVAGVSEGGAKAGSGPLPARFEPPGRCWLNERCVRDARPEGRDAAARARDRDGAVGGLARRWPGAVGHGGIVPYRARSPARSAAERHARTAVREHVSA